MNLADIHNVYFVGVGGIGMSAIARWFRSQDVAVYGYDRVSSPLTETLEAEGIHIHYQDDVALIADEVKSDQKGTLVVYTPAIQGEHSELAYFRDAGFVIMKRAEVLGVITKDKYTIGVAGTHGKTTTSSMLAHILETSGFGCNAFIGGIMTNYGSNLIMGGKDDVVVVEADEFDRSFLHLHPNVSIVTSVDPDHLDIYGDGQEMIRTFHQYVGKTDSEGMVILNERIKDQFEADSLPAKMITYSADAG
ncbi:MAG: Mur ligase domain-containing protein, partial [Bacteroidota bacterium]